MILCNDSTVVALENAQYCLFKRGDVWQSPVYFTSLADLDDMIAKAREGVYIVLDMFADKMQYITVKRAVIKGDWSR